MTDSAKAVDRWVEIPAAGTITEGEVRTFEVESVRLAIARADGHLHAVENVCSHDDGPLGDGSIDGHCIVCPRHGARFDVRTGAALTMPAVTPIEAYPVREEGGKVTVGLPSRPEMRTVIEDGSW